MKDNDARIFLLKLTTMTQIHMKINYIRDLDICPHK